MTIPALIILITSVTLAVSHMEYEGNACTYLGRIHMKALDSIDICDTTGSPIHMHGARR